MYIRDGSFRRVTIQGDWKCGSKEAAERTRRHVRRRWLGHEDSPIRFDRQKNQGGRGRSRRPWVGPAGTGSAFEEHRRHNCKKMLLARQYVKARQ
jgi:hypothetical protein